MNRLVWVMLVFLVVCTIAIGLISCGAKDRIEPNEPAISDGTSNEDNPLIQESDKNDKDKDKKPDKKEPEKEKEEVKLDVPTINSPSSGGNLSWTPPAYVPPVSTVTPPTNTDTSDKNVVYSEAGTYSTPAFYKDVIIESKGVILSNKTVTGDLVITEDVGSGDVYLNNVIVEGTLYVYGGGENSIYLEDVTADTVVVDKGKRGRVRLVASGKTEAKLVEAYSGVILKESSMNHNFAGFIDITTKPGNKLSSIQVTLYGCHINEIYALEETTLSIKSGCEIEFVNARKDTVTVNGEWSAINSKEGDVDRGSSGGSGGGGSSHSKDRIPTPKNLSYSVSPLGINVSWDSVSKADDYTIRVNGKTKNVTSTGYLSTDITDMIPEGKTTLSVEVRANRSSSSYKDSYYSDTLTIVDVVRPQQVKDAKLNYNPSDKKLTATWNNPGDNNIANFKIELVNKANNDVVLTKTAASTESMIELVVNGTQKSNPTYIAKITSIPKYSGTEIGITPEPVTASGEYTHIIDSKLPAPAGLTASYYLDSTKEVSLKWDAVLGAVSYEVFKNDVSAGTSTMASMNLTLTEDDIAKDVKFTVKAISEDVTYTSDLSAAYVLKKLTVPVNVKAEYKDRTVTLTWNKVDNASSYEILMDNAPVSDSNITITDTTAIITNVSAEKHTFKVRAKGSNVIYSDYSAEASLDTLAAPAGFHASYNGSNQTATLNWAPVEGAASYDILMDGSAPTSENISITGTQAVISNVSSKNHTFKVRAAASGKIPSEYAATEITKLAAPVNVQADKATITWDAVSGASGYQVYKGDTSFTVSSNTYTATENGQYAVAAIGEGSNMISSEKSASVSVTITPDSVQLTAPEVKLSKNGDAYQLDITAPNAASVTVNNGSSNLIVTGTAPSFTAVIPAADASYSVVAVGSAAAFTTDSPAVNVMISQISRNPVITLGNDGTVQISGQNAKVTVNGNPHEASSVILNSLTPGVYKIDAVVAPYVEGYKIIQGNSSQTYTVNLGAKPTVVPAVSKTEDSTQLNTSYQVVMSPVHNYSYTYKADVIYIDSTTASVDLILTEGKFSSVQLNRGNPDKKVSSFKVTVTAAPINPFEISGNTVVRYETAVLSSQPVTIPVAVPPAADQQTTPPAQDVPQTIPEV